MLKFYAALKAILGSTEKINSEYVKLKDAYADSDVPAFDDSMSLANSLIILGEDRGFVKKGTKVKVRFLD